MVKHLKLASNCGIFTDDFDYIKAKNDKLVIKISTSVGHNTKLYAKLNNGVEEKTLAIINKQFEIKDKFFNVGECSLRIIALVGNKIVGDYSCPSILVKEINGKNVIVDKLQEFAITIKEMRQDWESERENFKNEILKMQNALKELIIVE